MIRVPYWQWLGWTDQERAEVLTWLEGKHWFLDLAQDKPPNNSRISDFEEYEGEAIERGFDISQPRGFVPLGTQTNVGKKS